MESKEVPQMSPWDDLAWQVWYEQGTIRDRELYRMAGKMLAEWMDGDQAEVVASLGMYSRAEHAMLVGMLVHSLCRMDTHDEPVVEFLEAIRVEVD